MIESLQALSFGVIVKHFDQFHLAFTQQNDSTLQRNLVFLQRRYTDYLTKILLRNGEKTDAYFQFLINEHVTYVDFKWFKNSCYLNTIEEIFCRLPNLLLIDFDSCGNEILKNIAKYCPNIVAFNAIGPSLTDEGIAWLLGDENPPCPELTNISVRNTRISQTGAKCLLRYYPKIEMFDYPDIPLMVYEIVLNSKHFQIDTVCNFNLISFDFSNYADFACNAKIIKACTTTCPKLKKIVCHLSEQDELDALNDTHLEELFLKFPNNSHINLDDFIKVNGHNLSTLCIDNCNLSISFLSSYCPALIELAIKNVGFTNVKDSQAFFPSLIHCTFNYDAPDVIVEVFHLIVSKSPNLKTVIFSNCTLSSELEKEVLLWCTSPLIEEIGFNFMYIEIDFLNNVLMRCFSLKQMSFHSCNFDIDYPHESLMAIFECMPNKPSIDFE